MYNPDFGLTISNLLPPGLKLVGFWSTDLGGINEVNHLWEYGSDVIVCVSILRLPPTHICIFFTCLESYRHRADVHKALTLDGNWIDKCFSKTVPMFVSQVDIYIHVHRAKSMVYKVLI